MQGHVTIHDKREGPVSVEHSQRSEVGVDRAVVERVPIACLRPFPGNARTHSRKQIEQLAESLREFGFTNPVLISDDNEIIAGHARVVAAKLLGMHQVPTLRLSNLDATQRRAYVIADNKLALNAGWNREVLAVELNAIDLEFDVKLTGFSLTEVSLIVEEKQALAPDPAAAPPPIAQAASPISRCGDVWWLDHHLLTCGGTDLVLCDQILCHFEETTGRHVILAATGDSLAEVAKKRTISVGREGRP